MIETNGKKLDFKQYMPPSRREIKNVTISKKNIYFSASCDDWLQRKEFCELFYDEKQKVIAIKPIQLETLKTLRIRSNHRGCKLISIVGFLKRFEIYSFLGMYRPDFKSKKFIVDWNDKNKCFLIDLKNGG